MKTALIAAVVMLTAINCFAEVKLDKELRSAIEENRQARLRFNERMISNGDPDLCIPVNLPNTVEAINADTYYQTHQLRDEMRARGYVFPVEKDYWFLNEILKISVVLGILGFIVWCKIVKNKACI